MSVGNWWINGWEWESKPVHHISHMSFNTVLQCERKQPRNNQPFN